MTIDTDDITITELGKQLSNSALQDISIEHKLTDKRIELFARVVYCSIVIVCVFSLILVISVWVYLCRVSSTGLPNNFWHIPLMLCVLISTILGLLLTASAKFGSNNKKETTANIDPLPIKEQLSVIKEIINLTKSETK